MKGLFLIAVGVVSLAGTVASAELLTVHSLQFGANVKLKYGSADLNAWAGEQRVSIDGGTQFDAYCVDLDNHNTVPSTYTVTPTPTTALSNGGKAAWLYNFYGAGINSNTKGAALQIAIWDVVYDGGNGFATGSIKDNGTSSGILTQANTYLASIGSNTGVASWLKATHVNRKYQSLIGPDEYNPTPPVPEPFTLGFGAMALVAAARRRARRA